MVEPWPDQATPETRLLGLETLLDGLTLEERGVIRSYLVGAFVSCCDDEEWNDAIAGAVAMHNRLTDQSQVTRIYGW